MKTLWCIFAILCLHESGIMAQVSGRIEYPHNDIYEDRIVAPIKKQGLLIYSFAKEVRNKQRYFKTELYSTDMKLLFTDSLLIDKDMYYSNFVYEDNIAYIVLREKDGAFSVIAFDPQSKRTTVTDSEYTRKGSMRDLKIANGVMVFSSTQKKIDRIGIIDLKTGTGHFCDLHFPDVKDKNVYILENTVIDNVIYAMVQVERDIHIVRIDKQGKQLGETNLTADIDEKIISMSLSKANGKYFVTGTYTKAKKGGSQGIYFAQLDNWQFKNLKFINYLDLNNFTEYMSDSKQAKIERKKEKAEKEGKEYALKYLMASHDILSDGKDYYYLGEAYYPTYRTQRIGNTITTVFTGYNYTHAVLAKFDEQSNLLWDCCFPMEPKILPMYVKLFISTGFKDNNIDLIFADGKKLISKLFKNSDGSVTQDRKSELQETDKEDEEVKKSKNSGTQHWFDDNFVVYATQVVKNPATKERRRVFAVTKYTIR